MDSICWWKAIEFSSMPDSSALAILDARKRAVCSYIVATSIQLSIQCINFNWIGECISIRLKWIELDWRLAQNYWMPSHGCLLARLGLAIEREPCFWSGGCSSSPIQLQYVARKLGLSGSREPRASSPMIDAKFFIKSVTFFQLDPPPPIEHWNMPTFERLAGLRSSSALNWGKRAVTRATSVSLARRSIAIWKPQFSFTFWAKELDQIELVPFNLQFRARHSDKQTNKRTNKTHLSK